MTRVAALNDKPVGSVVTLYKSTPLPPVAAGRVTDAGLFWLSTMSAMVSLPKDGEESVAKGVTATGEDCALLPTELTARTAKV